VFIDALVICLACGAEHEMSRFDSRQGQLYDLCPLCNAILPHDILVGDVFSASDIESDLGIDLGTSASPTD